MMTSSLVAHQSGLYLTVEPLPNEQVWHVMHQLSATRTMVRQGQHCTFICTTYPFYSGGLIGRS